MEPADCRPYLGGLTLDQNFSELSEKILFTHNQNPCKNELGHPSNVNHGWNFSGCSQISGFRSLSEGNRNGFEMRFFFV